MKRYLFTICLVGIGEDEDSALENAFDGISIGKLSYDSAELLEDDE